MTLYSRYPDVWTSKIAILKQLGRNVEAMEAERQRDEVLGSS
jgi:hypothetical protein